MPRRTAHRYCHCGTRLAVDNPGDQCLACVRKEHEHLQRPPELPFEYWLTDRFDDAFAAQHIGLVTACARLDTVQYVALEAKNGTEGAETGL